MIISVFLCIFLFNIVMAYGKLSWEVTTSRGVHHRLYASNMFHCLVHTPLIGMCCILDKYETIVPLIEQRYSFRQMCGW